MEQPRFFASSQFFNFIKLLGTNIPCPKERFHIGMFLLNAATQQKTCKDITRSPIMMRHLLPANFQSLRARVDKLQPNLKIKFLALYNLCRSDKHGRETASRMVQELISKSAPQDKPLNINIYYQCIFTFNLVLKRLPITCGKYEPYREDMQSHIDNKTTPSEELIRKIITMCVEFPVQNTDRRFFFNYIANIS